MELIMTVLNSYDLNGKKLSFANWISNLSPMDTPFCSMTGKELIKQTLFQWQVDSLLSAGKNAAVEGAEANDVTLKKTQVFSNVTQILRKVVKVSDTADVLSNYGRGSELQYQMEKAGKEIKRDLEYAFLNNKGKEIGSKAAPRKTAGYQGLIAAKDALDPDTGAKVNVELTTAIEEKHLFEMTYNLYLAGGNANVIMFHPSFAPFFGSLQEKAGIRQRIFENTPEFSTYVGVIKDPLGQEFKLIPNRWMPEKTIYFFNPKDLTQMVLRAPKRTQLAKDGSYEKWMIEMEVGLRARNPYALGRIMTNAQTIAWDGVRGWNDKGFWNTDTAHM